MKSVLDEMKGFELYITLKITFKKPQSTKLLLQQPTAYNYE